MAKTNPILQAIREATPPEVNLQVDLAFQIANRIYELLEQKGMTQKDLARRLGKTETEVSRWLNGTHNLTLASIAKLSIALEANIIQIPHATAEARPYAFDDQPAATQIVADDSPMLSEP